ncbi:MAG TPA: AI-2E family transporter [Povalibacter sp.]|jgi:predicted PurR-regulated permease PerM|nr:AI-2E family transporter [Povalibacter sp.]
MASSPPSSTDPHHDRFYTRAFGVVTCAVLAVALYRIVMPFLGPLVWAIFLAFLLNPLHQWLTPRLRNRPQLSALLLTLLTLIVLVGPLTALSAAFASQVSYLLRFMQDKLADPAQANVLDFANVPWVNSALTHLDSMFGIDMAQVRDWIEQISNQGLHWLATLGGKVFLGALGTAMGFVLTIFMLFYFIRDGQAMFGTARELIPMTEARKARLFDHLANVTRAMVLGTGATALIQGTLVGIAFVIVGLPSPLVFGVIAVLASLLPIGGTALVWVPAAIVLAAQGRWGMMIFMVIWGALLVSLVDNVVRPMLVSGRANVGTLTVFIGVLGGLAAFGAIGLFLGPVVLALIIALIRFMLEVRRSDVAAATGTPAAPEQTL